MRENIYICLVTDRTFTIKCNGSLTNIQKKNMKHKNNKVKKISIKIYKLQTIIFC